MITRCEGASAVEFLLPPFNSPSGKILGASEFCLPPGNSNARERRSGEAQARAPRPQPASLRKSPALTNRAPGVCCSFFFCASSSRRGGGNNSCDCGAQGVTQHPAGHISEPPSDRTLTLASSKQRIFQPFADPGRRRCECPPSHLTLARAAAMPHHYFLLPNRLPKPPVPAPATDARASPLRQRRAAAIVPDHPSRPPAPQLSPHNLSAPC